MTQSLPVAALGRILAAQATFGFGWCLYLVQPKYLTVELGAGPEQVGLSSSVSAAASVAAIAAVVRVIDEPGGRRRLFQLGAVLLALASLGFQLVTDFGPLVLLLSAAIAVSYVLTFNSAMSLVTEVSPPGRLAQAFGLQTASNLVMNAISTSLAEALAVRFGWRSVFTVGASA
ncbi:MAG: MFS transporter, partial [Deltaproteobacteria bacterium]|nr:MFS transporter [Deltaproteobacteria bacterium]